MADLDALLDVQELDTAADVLRHRRAHLPERAELDARHAALAEVEREVAPLRDERRRIAKAQQAVEDEVVRVGEKIAAVDKAMYAGNISNPRELQAMQEEIDSLTRRRGVLEDTVLEHMLSAEPVDEAIAVAEGRRGEVDTEAVALLAALAQAEAAIDAELEELEGRRGSAAASVDGGLLERYEKLRARLKGVGVARLEGTRCLGCHLALPAAEVEAVRRQARAEGIAQCPQCDRLLVVS